MGFNFSQYTIKTGKTVPFVLNMLPGEPIVHLEWIGDTNSTWMSDQIGQANAKKREAAAKVKKTITAQDLMKRRQEDRDTLAKHAIRDLEATHTDTGEKATKADIPAFVAALPDDVIDTIAIFVQNQENFRERPVLDNAKELAEKS